MLTSCQPLLSLPCPAADKKACPGGTGGAGLGAKGAASWGKSGSGFGEKMQGFSEKAAGLFAKSAGTFRPSPFGNGILPHGAGQKGGKGGVPFAGTVFFLE